ncbi:ECF transporter S component [Fervidicella metallireducens]|nr:ECF transporter S component [Fervidicella metallireducens]
MERKVTERTQNNKRVYDMIITSMLTALVFLATHSIKIMLPISFNDGGLVHLGTGMLIIAALVFGKKKAAISGSVGMALFDLTSPWVAWAPFTFVIRPVMGYVMGAIAYSKGRNGESLLWNIIAIVVSGIWMIAGYYMTSVILYGNWVAPIASIPGDALQIVIGAAAGIPISAILKRTKLF